MPVAVELLLEAGVRIRAVTRDISASGIFVVVDKNVEVDPYLRFLITFPEQITTSCKLFALCDGVVVRRETSKGSQGLAIQIQKYQFLNSVS
jgi:hypothetical protein